MKAKKKQNGWRLIPENIQIKAVEEKSEGFKEKQLGRWKKITINAKNHKKGEDKKYRVAT